MDRKKVVVAMALYDHSGLQIVVRMVVEVQLYMDAGIVADGGRCLRQVDEMGNGIVRNHWIG